MDKFNIDYVYDKPYFDNLLSPKGNPLRPDFILPNERIWIEYDGEFHYKEIYNGDGHDSVVINDKIKNKYAKENNWNLIRIPYWEYNDIENILNDFNQAGLACYVIGKIVEKDQFNIYVR